MIWWASPRQCVKIGSGLTRGLVSILLHVCSLERKKPSLKVSTWNSLAALRKFCPSGGSAAAVQARKPPSGNYSDIAVLESESYRHSQFRCRRVGPDTNLEVLDCGFGISNCFMGRMVCWGSRDSPARMLAAGQNDMQ